VHSHAYEIEKGGLVSLNATIGTPNHYLSRFLELPYTFNKFEHFFDSFFIDNNLGSMNSTLSSSDQALISDYHDMTCTLGKPLCNEIQIYSSFHTLGIAVTLLC
jgi:hypothetical protein